MRFKKLDPGLYRSEDGRYSILKSSYRTGDRGHRKTVTTWTAYDNHAKDPYNPQLSLVLARGATRERVIERLEKAIASKGSVTF